MVSPPQPRRLISPTLLLETQTGTCFDISTLLCSLLLGAGYDAYCVTGYAVREMCLLDQSRQECPLLVGEVEVKVEVSGVVLICPSHTHMNSLCRKTCVFFPLWNA